jgi:hypothetical protein
MPSEPRKRTRKECWAQAVAESGLRGPWVLPRPLRWTWHCAGTAGDGLLSRFNSKYLRFSEARAQLSAWRRERAAALYREGRG